jgi:hypothetical protein
LDDADHHRIPHSTSLSPSQLFHNAFAQVFLNEEIFLKLPQGCTGKHGHNNAALKLNRSFCGLCQAAVCWFNKL